MTLSSEIRMQVRVRADYRCEFCGVAESDVGSELTVDHFQPASKGGTDELENLLYCCPRCNQYKLDYWPVSSADPSLWNPRHEMASSHLLQLDDGRLHPLTARGDFTIRRLRLNRPPLVAYRLQKLQRAEEVRLLSQYHDLVQLLEQTNEQLSVLMQEQRQLLREQRELLLLLLRRMQ